MRESSCRTDVKLVDVGSSEGLLEACWGVACESEVFLAKGKKEWEDSSEKCWDDCTDGLLDEEMAAFRACVKRLAAVSPHGERVRLQLLSDSEEGSRELEPLLPSGLPAPDRKRLVSVED